MLNSQNDYKDLNNYINDNLISGYELEKIEDHLFISKDGQGDMPGSQLYIKQSLSNLSKANEDMTLNQTSNRSMMVMISYYEQRKNEFVITDDTFGNNDFLNNFDFFNMLIQKEGGAGISEKSFINYIKSISPYNPSNVMVMNNNFISLVKNPALIVSKINFILSLRNSLINFVDFV